MKLPTCNKVAKIWICHWASKAQCSEYANNSNNLSEQNLISSILLQ